MIPIYANAQSRLKQLVISIEEILDELHDFRPTLAFSHDGLDGVIWRMLCIDRRDLINYQGQYSDDSLGMYDLGVEVVKEELFYEIDRRIAENTLPASFDVDERLLHYILVSIAQAVANLYHQFLGADRYVIWRADRLMGRGVYFVVAEPL